MPEVEKLKTVSPVVTELQQLAAEAKALWDAYVKKIEALHLKEDVQKDEAALAEEALTLRKEADAALATYEKDAEALVVKFYKYIEAEFVVKKKLVVSPVVPPETHGETGAVKDNDPAKNF